MQQHAMHCQSIQCDLMKYHTMPATAIQYNTIINACAINHNIQCITNTIQCNPIKITSTNTTQIQYNTNTNTHIYNIIQMAIQIQIQIPI